MVNQHVSCGLKCKLAFQAAGYVSQQSAILSQTHPAQHRIGFFVVCLQIGGKFIPKGSVLFLSFFMGQLLSDPKLHKHITPEALRNVSPEQLLLNATTIKREFHPERWLADPNSSSGDLPKPAGLLTFNTGPHICLGMGLFYTEAKVLLALLARGYNMEIQNPEEVGFHASFVTQLNSQPLVRFSKVPAGAGAVMAKSKLAAR